MLIVAVPKLNRFHCEVVPSLMARSPTIITGEFCPTAFCTIVVAPNSTVPVPAQLNAPSARWLATPSAVIPPFQYGWLFHVVAEPMSVVNHNLAFDDGLQVHDHRCSMLNVAPRICLPNTPDTSIRNSDRTR